MSSLTYWLWLSAMRPLGHKKTHLALEAFGAPEGLWAADEEEIHQRVPALSRNDLRLLADKSTDEAERIAESCQTEGITILTMQDVGYPGRLKNIDAPPAVLYVKGRLPELDDAPTLTVVGSRTPSAYGANVAQRLSFYLARAGMLIVSGLAKGIDASAHIGALRAGKPTVAVLGCGPDVVVYPKVNEALFEDVATAGAIITEYPPGTPAIGANFPARNRIMSGLSLGVLVVEASARSGALITANHALEQGRDVFAVPGAIDSDECAGCNRLIQEGAVLVTSAQDVVREYEPLYPHKISVQALQNQSFSYRDLPQQPREEPVALVAEPSVVYNEAPKSPPPPKAEAAGTRVFDLSELIKDFTDDQQTIILAIAGTARHVDDIIEITQIPAPRVLAALTLLELGGAVTQMPGRRFQLNLDALGSGNLS